MATKLNNTQANSLASKLQRQIKVKLERQRDEFYAGKEYQDALAKLRKSEVTIVAMMDLEKSLTKLETQVETVNEGYQSLYSLSTKRINKDKLLGHVSYSSNPDSIYITTDKIKEKREYLEKKLLAIQFNLKDVAIPDISTIFDELVISTIDSTTDLEKFMQEFVEKFSFLPK